MRVDRDKFLKWFVINLAVNVSVDFVFDMWSRGNVVFDLCLSAFIALLISSRRR